MNEEKLKKQMANKIKKIKPEDGFHPYTMSLYKVCELAGKLEYFNQIRNRIYWELEADESLGDYVRIDPENLEDIFLDNDGILIFSEILNGYFGEGDIKDIWKYTRDLNKFEKSNYEFNQMFKSLSTPDLKKFIEKYVAYVPKEGEEEARKLLIEKGNEELKNRRKFSFTTKPHERKC